MWSMNWHEDESGISGRQKNSAIPSAREVGWATTAQRTVPRGVLSSQQSGVDNNIHTETMRGGKASQCCEYRECEKRCANTGNKARGGSVMSEPRYTHVERAARAVVMTRSRADEQAWKGVISTANHHRVDVVVVSTIHGSAASANEARVRNDRGPLPKR